MCFNFTKIIISIKHCLNAIENFIFDMFGCQKNLSGIFNNDFVPVPGVTFRINAGYFLTASANTSSEELTSAIFHTKPSCLTR